MSKVLMAETSASRRALAENCWEAFYHRYVEKLPAKASAATERGNATHLALYNLVMEMLNNRLIKSTAREVKKFVEEACKTELTPIIHPKNVVDTVSSMVRYGLAGFDPADYEVVVPEMEFGLFIDEAGHFLNGRIDLFLVRKDGVCVLVDYKTGSVYEADGDIQLATYALAAREKAFSANNIQACLKFLDDKIIKRTNFSEEYLDYVLEIYVKHCEEVDRRLAIGKEAFPAKPSWFCEWCSYKPVCSIRNQIGLLPITYKDISLSQMKEVMKWVLVVEPLVSEAKALIKQMTEDKGAFGEVNGEYFGMFPSVSREIDAEELIKLFGSNGIFDMSVFKVVISKLEKKYRNDPLWEQIELLFDESIRRTFGHKSYLPNGMKVISEVTQEDKTDVA